MPRWNPDKEEYWNQKIAEWNRSGLNKARWCRENNIKSYLFDYWQKRLACTSSEEQAQFIEIKDESHTVSTGNGIVLYAGGVKIGLDDSFDENMLKRVLHLLKRLP